MYSLQLASVESHLRYPVQKRHDKGAEVSRTAQSSERAVSHLTEIKSDRLGRAGRRDPSPLSNTEMENNAERESNRKNKKDWGTEVAYTYLPGGEPKPPEKHRYF